MSVSAEWDSAVRADLLSPDGNWRWTGAQWLPAKRRHRKNWPRPVAISLVAIGLVMLPLSGLLLALHWSQDLNAVHQVVGPTVHEIHLGAGTYLVYEDPNGDAPLPLPAHVIHIVGPEGPIAAQSVPHGVIRPGLIAAPFQGTGLFMPVAKFVAVTSGVYLIKVGQLPEMDKVFVAPSEGQSLLAVMPWTIGVVIGAIVMIVGWQSLRSNLRPLRLTAH